MAPSAPLVCGGATNGSPTWARLITEQWLLLWNQNGSFSFICVRTLILSDAQHSFHACICCFWLHEFLTWRYPMTWHDKSLHINCRQIMWGQTRHNPGMSRSKGHVSGITLQMTCSAMGLRLGNITCFHHVLVMRISCFDLGNMNMNIPITSQVVSRRMYGLSISRALKVRDG